MTDVIGLVLDILSVRTMYIQKILNFNFDVPSRTSPICCSRGYPGGWIWIFITKLVYKYHMEIYRKSYEYCFIKGEILNFLTFGKKKKKDKEN